LSGFSSSTASFSTRFEHVSKAVDAKLLEVFECMKREEHDMALKHADEAEKLMH
jgi:hypothetical protein